MVELWQSGQRICFTLTRVSAVGERGGRLMLRRIQGWATLAATA